MNKHNEVYVQTIKRNVLSWITTICIATALMLAIKEAPTGIIIALTGVAAIQGYRSEKANRRLKEMSLTTKQAKNASPANGKREHYN